MGARPFCSFGPPVLAALNLFCDVIIALPGDLPSDSFLVWFFFIPLGALSVDLIFFLFRFWHIAFFAEGCLVFFSFHWAASPQAFSRLSEADRFAFFFFLCFPSLHHGAAVFVGANDSFSCWA